MLNIARSQVMLEKMPVLTFRRVMLLAGALALCIAGIYWITRPGDALDMYCEPQTRIGFAKTHKTASSSVQNILFRHAFNHDLNLVLPKVGNHLSPSESPDKLKVFKADDLKDVPWHDTYAANGLYHIQAMHVTWNHMETRKLLGDETKFITILRHPVDEFESLYVYAGFHVTTGMDLKSYIQQINATLDPRTFNHPRIRFQLGWSQQLVDLGMNPKDLNNDSLVMNKILEIEQEFQLVMISEMMDESLVLMADLLCWPLSDVMTLKHNARKEESKVSLTPDERNVLERFLQPDLALYNHFKDKMETLIPEIGQAWVQSQVQTLKQLNQNLSEVCVDKVVTKEELEGTDFAPWSPLTQGFQISDTPGCDLYAIGELQFVDKMRRKMVDDWEGKKHLIH